jgi:hypothetical protein
MRTTFRGSSDMHILDRTGADSSVSGAFSSVAPGSPNCRLLAIIGAAYQEEQTYTRTALLQAATEFHDAIEQQRSLLPYHYSYQIGDGTMFGRGSGGASGFHIDGKIHSIQGGAGVCYLQEIGVGSDGRGQVVNTIDIRGEKRVETDDFGPIKIYRRKLSLTLFETVPPLVSFLRNSKDEVFRTLTTEGKPSVMDLVRLAGEGSGADDWAEEQLHEMGQDGLAALIAELGNPRARKHLVTIARLLLTVFPSHESRRAVEQLVDQEQDQERKVLYLAFLASAPRED